MSHVGRSVLLKLERYSGLTFLEPSEMDKTRISICLFLAVWSNVEGQSGVPGQSGYNMYSRLNPITYYGFTQPYLSGFYGGIGGMPYMSSWQASMYQGDNSQNPMALMGLAMGGPGLGGLVLFFSGCAILIAFLCHVLPPDTFPTSQTTTHPLEIIPLFSSLTSTSTFAPLIHLFARKSGLRNPSDWEVYVNIYICNFTEVGSSTDTRRKDQQVEMASTMPASLGRFNYNITSSVRDHWAPLPTIKNKANKKKSPTKKNFKQPQQLTKQRTLPATFNNSKCEWRYSKAAFKAHMMLPEPLPIPKSVLWDYKKKPTSSPKKSSRASFHSFNSFSSFSGSVSSPADSGADDLSETSSVHSDWESIFNNNSEHEQPSFASFSQLSLSTKQLNPDVVALPMSPAAELHPFSYGAMTDLPPAPSHPQSEQLLQRPLSPVLGIMTPPNSPMSESMTDSAAAVAMAPLRSYSSSSQLSQLHFECARCFIVYPSVDLMEKHIGQFHALGHFELSEDNFTTMVRAVWDADLTLALLNSNMTAPSRRSSEPVHFEWAKPTSPSECVSDLYEEQPEESYCTSSENGETASSTSSSEGTEESDSGMETEDGSEYSLDEQSVQQFEEDVEKVIASYSGPPSPVKQQPVMLCKRSDSCPAMVFSGKNGNGMTRKMLAAAMRKVNKIIGGPSVLGNKYTAGAAASAPKRPFARTDSTRLVPKKVKLIRGDGKMVKKSKNMRKCRGVYGVESASQWCNMCKWKKKCSRFSLDNGKEE
ncbi:hypothetical protein BV898_02487 [Hypsibius exemplaris]|uniref:C2H2-type domain-containing protein n=1 Tax=Hypsibius exemplaris TaxID=2072580 RepID=A0A1W0X8N3_HYPEX|nr:hypothetical protein BV898_02487 [Hypsibius exemplaris]